MGTSLSRQNAAVEEADVTLNHPYKYPPRTGNYRHLDVPITFRTMGNYGPHCIRCDRARCCLAHKWNGMDLNWIVCQNILIIRISGTYFGTHFIMGGERFDTPQPEAYLFGENGDLNFLGSRPTAVSVCVSHFRCSQANWVWMWNTSFTWNLFRFILLIISVSISATTSEWTNQNTQEFD